MPDHPREPGTQHGVGPGSFDAPSSRVPVSPSQAGLRGGIGSPIGATGLLQSFEGVVTSSQMVAQESQKATKEVLAATERTARMMGTIIERAGQMMGYQGQGMPLWQAWSQSGEIGLDVAVPSGGYGRYAGAAPISTAAPVAPRAVAAPAVTPPTPPGASGAPVKPSTDAPSSGMTRGQGMKRPVAPEGVSEGLSPEGDGSRFRPANWEEGTGYFGGGSGNYDPSGFSLGNLRQDVARGVNKRVSEWGIKYQRTEDAAGRWHDARGRFASAPDWKTKGVGITKNVLGAMSEGEGLGGAIASAAPRIGATLGVIGAGYAAVRMGEQFAVSQRAANMEYQSVLGGSNAEGFGERARAFGYRMSMFGTMDSGDSKKIYMGAMENYGTNREMRNVYQDSAADLYRNAGLSADEGTRLLNLAAGEGNDHLHAFANAIKSVGKAARDAGESAADARNFFEQSFQSAHSFSTGTAQIGAARSMAKLQIGLGDQYGDVSFSGMDSPMNLRRQAQLIANDPNLSRKFDVSGYADYIAGTTSGQANGSLLIASGRQKLIDQAVINADPTGRLFGEASARLQEMAHDSGAVTDQQLNRVAAELQAKYDIDPTILATNIRNAGIENVSDANAMSLYLRLSHETDLVRDEQSRIDGITSNVSPSGQTVKDVDGDEHKLKKFDKRRRVALQGKMASDDWDEYLRSQFGMKKGSAKDDFRYGFNESSGKGMAANRSMSGRVRNSLLNTFKDKKFYSGVATEFYNQLDDQFGDDARFVVKTKKGERAVDAYRLVDTYIDQLRANPEDIRVIGGDQDGRTVGEVLGVAEGEEGVKVRSIKAGGKTGGEYGEKVRAAEKEAGKKQKADSGRVEIVPSPELLRYFQFQSSGSAYTSYTNGMPPASSATTPSEDRYKSGTN